MKASFYREVIGSPPNSYVTYAPISFEDKEIENISWKGKEAFQELKKYCIQHGYFTVDIAIGRKTKRYFFRRKHTV